ncbi:Branched-chain amino acid transport protein (AzlD) [Corynebacterium freiburgense]|nr:AzlD domain-containing protein [Corynebacterium freiburgense]WJZ03968.1 Branched-chain amino acid transport protein (AzlD) [Corynebacterium freiburgense]
MFGLPEGISLGYTVSILLSIGTVTVLLRWLPFRIVSTLRGSSFLNLLSQTMPVGVMLILVVYTAPSFSWAYLFSVAITLALHIWRKSAVLSILTGTSLYMLLMNI